MTKYPNIKIVKSIEEAVGEEYWKVEFPWRYNEQEIDAALKMACKYGNLAFTDYENLSKKEILMQYDGYFEKAVKELELGNGQSAFFSYLTDVYQCHIEPYQIHADFEFQW